MNLQNILKHLPEFEYVSEHSQARLSRLCCEVRFYFESDLETHADDLLQLQDRALTLLPGEIHHWFTPFSARYDSTGKISFRKKTKAMSTHLTKWIDNEKWDNPFAIELHGSERDDSISDVSFQLCNDPYRTGYIRLLLPIETLEQGNQALRDIAVELIDDFPFISGYIGFGLHVFTPTYQKLTLFEPFIPALLERFHCVDFTDPYRFKEFEDTALLNIGWCTLLGPKRKKQSKVNFSSRKLPSGFSAFEMGKGVGIQISEEPSLGMVGVDDLAPYREAAKLFSRIRHTRESVAPFDSLGGTEVTGNWVARFD